MSAVIRLARGGRTHEAIYRLVVADSRNPRDGKFLAQLGNYNPNVEPPVVQIETDSVIEWLEKGAQPSDTVKSLLKITGIFEKYQAKLRGEDVSSFQLKPKGFPKKKAALSKKAQAKAQAENKGA